MAEAQARESVALRARRKRNTTSIPTPEVQQYGVFTPGYAGYLQQTAGATGPTASAALAAGNAAALRMNTDAEQTAYANMLGRAQDLQTEAQKRDIAAEFEGDIGERNLDYMKEGVGGIESVEVDPETGESRITRNPIQQQVGNAYNLGMKRAKTFGEFATGIGTFTKETGLRPTKEAIQQMTRDLITGALIPFTEALSPADELAASTTVTPEERAADREVKMAEVNAKLEGQAKVEHMYNEEGELMGLKWTGPWAAVQQGKAEMQASGWDPGTGEYIGTKPPPKVSPNAGAQGGGASATPAAAIPVIRGDLTDYRDAGYDAIENRLERKYNLPPGLMKRIRMFGEKTNASGPNSVSKKGARTVYQFTPGTRQHFMEKFKIDPWSSPQAAAESAAIHLSDSIKRGQDPVLEYNAGPKARGAWGSKEAQEYKARVDGPQALQSTRPQARAENMIITRLRANPQVANVARDDKTGHLTVTLRSGKKMIFDRGRRIG